ncbi:hypothetical protein GpartN1_g2986.t1 [Galdieria partita]|uniref:RNA helicase n=1 Tax=Galdieria partita TaxID=83374 RepID=A0A9C7PVD4_9RHOD|nr:hypothetical protein GpartN1_g2986.t1 [Galdieria partita]
MKNNSDKKCLTFLFGSFCPHQHSPCIRNAYFVNYFLSQQQRLDLHVRRRSKTTITLRTMANCDQVLKTTEETGFHALGVSETTCRALVDAFDIHIPTAIQRKAIPAIAGGANVIVGAVTGSGKSLAYLIPVLEKLKLQEELQGFMRKPKKPRALVFVPTRELGEQLLRVLKSLSHHVKFRAISLLGGRVGFVQQKKSLEECVDIVVCSPNRLVKHAAMGNIYFGDIRFVVMDEVDALLGDDFVRDLDVLLAKLPRKTSEEERIQFIAVGATHPKQVFRIYEKYFPNAKQVNDKLHTLPENTKHVFVNVRGDDATQELISLLQQEEEKMNPRNAANHIIVFCNTVASCRFVEHYLSERGYHTVNYHGEIPPKKRTALFSEFLTNKRVILICTDVGARGLDNVSVKLVLNFEFPTCVVDYIHRAGRTGRAGNSGKVVSFVRKKDLLLARAIERGISQKKDLLEYTAQLKKMSPN